MSTIPQELNWVQRRFTCSLGQMFGELVRGFENDIAVFNSLKGLPEDRRFVAESAGEGRVLVIAQYGTIPSPRVAIYLLEEKIEVRDAAKQIRWSVGVRLNSEGRCVLLYEEETELEQWQFRKKALEGLFFGD